MTTAPVPDPQTLLRKRLAFRAWHRGTREADYMIGGFFDRHSADWNADQLAWFEQLVEEDDVEIMAWAIGTAVPPARIADSAVGAAMIAAMRRLDYIVIP